jgi:hypothetical protein
MALRSAINTVAKRVALATAAQVCYMDDYGGKWKERDGSVV